MSKLYSVSCECPTPLAANPFEVLAEDNADAVLKFKLRNGIIDTEHTITAVETDGLPSSEPEGEQSEGNQSSGGQPDEEKPSERQQIKNYLVDHAESTNKQVVEALAALGTVVTSSQVSAARKDV